MEVNPRRSTAQFPHDKDPSTGARRTLELAAARLFVTPMNPILPTIAFWKQAFKQHGSKCVYCPEARQVSFAEELRDFITSSIDHVISVSKGGANHPENIVPACVICNFYKRDHRVSEPEYTRLTETRADGHTYVRQQFFGSYIEVMRGIVENHKERKRAEFEAFREYVKRV